MDCIEKITDLVHSNARNIKNDEYLAIMNALQKLFELEQVRGGKVNREDSNNNKLRASHRWYEPTDSDDEESNKTVSRNSGYLSDY